MKNLYNITWNDYKFWFKIIENQVYMIRELDSFQFPFTEL